MTYFLNHHPLPDVFRLCFYVTVIDTATSFCSLQRFDTRFFAASFIHLYRHALCTIGTYKLKKLTFGFNTSDPYILYRHIKLLKTYLAVYWLNDRLDEVLHSNTKSFLVNIFSLFRILS